MILSVLFAPQSTTREDTATSAAVQTLETVDLVAVITQPQPSSQFQQTSADNVSQIHLPLKAVYKGSVLGLRYLSPSTSNAASPFSGSAVFNRVQVKFTTLDELSRFVDAIKDVCPVKPANAGAVGDGDGEVRASAAISNQPFLQPPKTQSQPRTQEQPEPGQILESANSPQPTPLTLPPGLAKSPTPPVSLACHIRKSSNPS